MCKITIIIFLMFMFSCTQKDNIELMENRIKTLELKVDSLEQSIKLMTVTDSIIVEHVFTPEEGSLLEEIGKMQ